MRRRVQALIGLVVATIIIGVVGEQADSDAMRFIAGLLFFTTVLVAVSLLWRPPALPAMPGLFKRPGPDRSWDVATGAPGPGRKTRHK